MVYLHSSFSFQTKLLNKSPQCTVTSVFSPILQWSLVVQRQEALDMLGDIRIPEGPKTSPPQLGIVVVGIGVGVGVGVAKMVCIDPFKDCMSYETA